MRERVCSLVPLFLVKNGKILSKGKPTNILTEHLYIQTRRALGFSEGTGSKPPVQRKDEDKVWIRDEDKP